MSQGFILGPLLFNIFISGPFLFIENTTPCNYADINTMYYLDKPPNIVINRLRHGFAKILERFYENYIVLNADKCRFVNVGFNEPFPDFSFNDNYTEENVTEEKIILIVIDNKLDFKSHLKNVCKKS